MNHLELVYEYTLDGIRLMGGYFNSSKKDICVVFIHGMAGNLINNYFATVWGDLFVQNDISFLFGHTRGHSYINYLTTNDNKYKKCGTAYEEFDECIYDVDLWVNYARNKGYKKVILLGHSLGCNKVIHYLYKKGNVVDGIILASPPDMIGLVKNEQYEPDYKNLIKEAKQNILNGKKNQLLTKELWEEHIISSKTFLNYTIDNSSVDNLPILRNPTHFKELETISVPILAFLGEKDDIIIRSVEKDLNLIKEKAISCPNFETMIIKNANHSYEKVEKEAGEYIKDWIKKYF